MKYRNSHHVGGIYRDGFESRRDCDGLGMGNWNGSGYGGVGVYVNGSHYAYDEVNCRC